jgi:single-stranded-DNA-specific exonuclease
VALGTIADIVPLLGENRILVKHGIKVLASQLRPGIRALFEIARVSSDLKPADITFKLAPRINAAGRLGDAEKALALLKTNNIIEAYKFAKELEKYNIERQTTEEKIFNEAQKQIREKVDIENTFSILVAGHNWHQGVIGIVASRISREYNRPAIVLSIQDGVANGSGRSIENLNMVEILLECSGLLTRYGGHPMAVGLAMAEDKIAAFAAQFEVAVKKKISRRDLIDQINIDGDVELRELDPEFFRLLQELGPFGHSNPQPIFRLGRVTPVRVATAGVNHTRGLITDHNGGSLGFIAFNRGISSMPTGDWEVVGSPQINEYRGEKRNQLQIIDLKAAG